MNQGEVKLKKKKKKNSNDKKESSGYEPPRKPFALGAQSRAGGVAHTLLVLWTEMWPSSYAIKS